MALAVAVLVTLTACADAARSGTPAGPAAPDVTDDAADRDVPLLQVHVRGGFVPVGWDFASVPELTVYEDGRAVVHGPQIALYPPPILPHLVQVALDATDVDALVTAARDAGLLADVTPGYGRPPVADAPTTYVSLHVEGRTSTHAAEALGMVDDVGAPAEAVDPAAPEGRSADDRPAAGLTPEERAARTALAAFVTRAHELVGAVGGEEPYRVEAFAVMARPAPAAEAEDAGAADGPGEAAVTAWPLTVEPPADGDCLVVAGEDARTLRDALAGLGSTTRFEQAGVRYDAWFRPLLPHEDGCET